jgi:lysophospholipase L1-like esterase
VKEPVEARAATSIEHIATTEQMERYLATLVARLESPVACAYINPWSPLLAETNGVFDRVAEQRLQAAAARLKIPMVATGAAVQAYVRQTGQPINGFHKTERGPGEGHLNPAGHRLMASCLAPVMARLLSSELRLRELRVAQYQAGAPVRARSRPDQGRA